MPPARLHAMSRSCALPGPDRVQLCLAVDNTAHDTGCPDQKPASKCQREPFLTPTVTNAYSGMLDSQASRLKAGLRKQFVNRQPTKDGHFTEL